MNISIQKLNLSYLEILTDILSRRGLAQKMLAFAETFGREQGYFSIRLDAFSGNTAAIKLYEKNNYRMRGTVRFRKGEFYCYEKNLMN
ncbi:MAG TPA: GNAT family N-acetyltransferase [Treponemataceae bacterium]|nr:GNAT family N-acetyltransferase [Treponemataceae bacterium]